MYIYRYPSYINRTVLLVCIYRYPSYINRAVLLVCDYTKMTGRKFIVAIREGGVCCAILNCFSSYSNCDASCKDILY